jgi:hypothetical protein
MHSAKSISIMRRSRRGTLSGRVERRDGRTVVVVVVIVAVTTSGQARRSCHHATGNGLCKQLVAGIIDHGCAMKAAPWGNSVGAEFSS